jgi:hypothetical protein
VTAEPLGDGVAAWRVRDGGRDDLVLLRAPGAPTTFEIGGGISIGTDADILVVSLGDEPAALRAGGTAATVEGVGRAPGSGIFVVEE